MWTLLLLAATVRSFAHMPLGVSDRNSIIAPQGTPQIWGNIESKLKPMKNCKKKLKSNANWSLSHCFSSCFSLSYLPRCDIAGAVHFHLCRSVKSLTLSHGFCCGIFPTDLCSSNFMCAISRNAQELGHDKGIGVARGQSGHGPFKFLENIAILCFSRRFFQTK